MLEMAGPKNRCHPMRSAGPLGAAASASSTQEMFHKSRWFRQSWLKFSLMLKKKPEFQEPVHRYLCIPKSRCIMRNSDNTITGSCQGTGNNVNKVVGTKTNENFEARNSCFNYQDSSYLSCKCQVSLRMLEVHRVYASSSPFFLFFTMAANCLQEQRIANHFVSFIA